MSITIKDRGSFFVGGHKHTLKGLPVQTVRYSPGSALSVMDPNGDYQVGQMYVQYNRLERPRCPYPVLLAHGGGLTGVCWETTPDGRPGWDTLLLEKGFDMYVSDGVERGRASWARYPEINPGPPLFKTYQLIWEAFRLGRNYGQAYQDQQFPVEALDDFMKQNVPRWVTSAEWTQAAFDEYVGMMEQGCILIAHSTGCLFAAQSALRHPENVKACVLLEPANLPNPQLHDSVTLRSVPFLALWGDYLGKEYPQVSWSEFAYNTVTPDFFNAVRKAGGRADIIDLPELGFRGNSHMLMMDKNSKQVLDVVLKWLEPLLA